MKSKGEDIEPLKAKGEQLKNDSAQADAALAEVQEKLEAMLQGIPNIPHSSVPQGNDEDDNVEVRRWGSLRASILKLKIMWIWVMHLMYWTLMLPLKLPARASPRCAAHWPTCTGR